MCKRAQWTHINQPVHIVRVNGSLSFRADDVTLQTHPVAITTAGERERDCHSKGEGTEWGQECVSIFGYLLLVIGCLSSVLIPRCCRLGPNHFVVSCHSCCDYDWAEYDVQLRLGLDGRLHISFPNPFLSVPSASGTAQRWPLTPGLNSLYFPTRLSDVLIFPTTRHVRQGCRVLYVMHSC